MLLVPRHLLRTGHTDSLSKASRGTCVTPFHIAMEKVSVTKYHVTFRENNSYRHKIHVEGKRKENINKLTRHLSVTICHTIVQKANIALACQGCTDF